MDCYGNIPNAGPDNGVFKLVVYIYIKSKWDFLVEKI